MNDVSKAYVLEARKISKVYEEASESLSIFENLDFFLSERESVGILGSSGSGKTTLLNILAGLDKATTGEVRLCGSNLSKASESQLTKLRNEHLGFVYQFHHLLAEFSAVENIAMPLYISGQSVRSANNAALELLDMVGLSKRSSHKPSELSGGERQRVAIARALVNKPRCVLMDEPTGNLDEHTARKIEDVMISLQRELGTSFIVVTHDVQLAHRMDRVLVMDDGNLKQADPLE